MAPIVVFSMLKILPIVDSDEMADRRRCELDIPRSTAAALGRSAVEAGVRGYYVVRDNTNIDWSCEVRAACKAKVSIPPDAPLPIPRTIHFTETRVQVANETTLAASRRLFDDGFRPLALNFANGISPGGGFLNGARAQEEVLCRSSALFQTLVDDEMYEQHRQRPRPDSTAWAIYSPDVPIFRSDNGKELDRPWPLSILTCAAPYAPTIGQPEAGKLLRDRIHRILDIARCYGYSALVLGAWGCGAFGNDPRQTARDFRYALENRFSRAFSRIVFAITDWSPERRFLGPFCEVFAPDDK